MTTQTHTPKIRKPTDEELNAAIGHAEAKGMFGLLGALLELRNWRAMDKFIQAMDTMEKEGEVAQR